MKFELPRGMRDLEAEEYQTIELIKQKFFDTAELFGFNFMEPSPIELLSTVEAKSGPSIENEIYGFKDKGGRDVALRFDLTVGLTRYVVSRRDLRLPTKLASFGSMWRYDEPQMGRYRWFHQWDVEIYDSFNIESDAEIIEFTASYLRMLGLKHIMIDACDRELLEDFIRTRLQVKDQDTLLAMLRAVDKVSKKGDKAVIDEYTAKGFDAQKLQKVIELSKVKGDVDEVLADDRINSLSKVDKLTNLLDSLKSRGVKNAKINMGIVRGLDYYSGIVFEAFEKSSDVGALVGGGRYDTLTAAFGRSDMGATGAAGGIERIASVLLKQGLSGLKLPNKPRVYVAYVQEDLRQRAVSLAAALRRNSIVAEFDIGGRSLKKQLEEASKKGYMLVAILAPEELLKNELVLRNMTKGSETKVKFDDFLNNPSPKLK
ncbi:MAG: histidine--tRNA ligase [Nitrososphaerales archaeon]